MSRVAVGGTFNILHAGHRELLKRAIDETGNGELLIGLTTDEFASKDRDTELRLYEERERTLREFISSFSVRYEISPINNRFGHAVDGDIDALVASEATEGTAREINRLRKERGRKEVNIIVVPHVLAADSIPISSTRILHGEIDENGRLKGKMVVAAGSQNLVKVSAIQDVFQRAFPTMDIEIMERKVASGVSEQPFNEETITGAINRAANAMKGTGAHYGVGIEAGLFFNPTLGKYLDVQYCAIIDRNGLITVGHGAGFSYPDEVISAVLDGKKDGVTIGDAMKEVYGKEDIGRKEGAVGFLSRDLLKRKELTEHAVIAALIPRINRMAEGINQSDRVQA